MRFLIGVSIRCDFFDTMRLYSAVHRATTSFNALDVFPVAARRSSATACLIAPKKSMADGDCFWAVTHWMPGLVKSMGRRAIIENGFTG